MAAITPRGTRTATETPPFPDEVAAFLDAAIGLAHRFLQGLAFFPADGFAYAKPVLGYQRGEALDICFPPRDGESAPGLESAVGREDGRRGVLIAREREFADDISVIRRVRIGII